MESVLKVINGTTLNTFNNLHTTRHLHFTFSQLQNLFFHFLTISIESFSCLERWKPSIFHIFILSCFVTFIIIKRNFIFNATRPVYLVDFSCLKPPSFCRVPFSTFIENVSLMNIFDKDSISFMSKTLHSSGQSKETCLPPSLHYIPPITHQRESINEVHMVLFPVMEDLLLKTKISPQDIDILIVNCSGFCPSPSLSSIVINKYSMRSDIKSYNLSGMGCSASAVAIQLAQNLLQVHNNSYAVIISSEILSNGWYAGNEPPKLILNCLFRMGAAAILLTNSRESIKHSKYKLFKSLRTQRAFDEKKLFFRNARRRRFRKPRRNPKPGFTPSRRRNPQIKHNDSGFFNSTNFRETPPWNFDSKKKIS